MTDTVCDTSQGLEVLVNSVFFSVWGEEGQDSCDREALRHKLVFSYQA